MPQQKTPTPRTVRKKKLDLGFKRVKIIKKPWLTNDMMIQRHRFAQQNIGRSFKNIWTFDEKWFTEEKVDSQYIEARTDSPLGKQRFKAKAAETDCQRHKIMLLVAVTEEHKIGLYELDVRRYNEEHNNKHKGVTKEMLRPVIIKIARAARKAMPHGPRRKRKISVWYDRAGSHTASATRELIAEYFDGDFIEQPPKSPDLNMCDAALFQFMERVTEGEGAITKEEISKASKVAWRAITAESLGRMADRVRRNLATVAKIKGKNFYIE